MPRLIWSPRALADVQRLYRFLAEKDKSAARRAIKSIRTSVKILAYQPKAGRLVDDMEAVYREWPIDFGNSGYLVMYRYEEKTVTILAVRHQKEDQY